MSSLKFSILTATSRLDAASSLRGMSLSQRDVLRQGALEANARHWSTNASLSRGASRDRYHPARVRRLRGADYVCVAARH